MQNINFSEPARESESGIFFRKACSTVNPKARLLLLHGVGSNEANLASLAASLPEEIEILLLRGPLQLGPQGFAWYQVNFTSDGPSFNQEQAESSRQLLIRFIQALPPLPIVIAGFSQGGIMSSSVGVTQPELVAGFALLSGRMLREIEPKIAPRDQLQGVSAFIAHGQQDNVLPIDWAHEADAWLSRIGVQHQTHFYDMAHEIIPQELADFSQWLDRTLSLSN
ncbi:phospholipase [Pseudomonas syringae pv. syringae]|uniref:alpha/beta hydrolase n=1 Tax=Pseudomonas TaxID=286 RepID=UPI0006B96217|nr:phospholipase [Pseudomonas syringae]AVB26307.1 phospholipase [Pseudomonas syringae pv. syringae]KWS14078.1 phospholipase [Pseudomonas syringae pv. syringae]MCF5179820.1 phospholipase [Pseudomonas syringae]MCF5316082.1 phospholipase [Pseudomonas syringae]MCF5361806.1 phospholipase [Pseudomonas syringae]